MMSVGLEKEETKKMGENKLIRRGAEVEVPTTNTERAGNNTEEKEEEEEEGAEEGKSIAEDEEFRGARA